MTDVSEAWILRDLSFSEVRAILATRRRDQDIHIYIWTDAWSDWKSLSELEVHSFKTPRRETQKPPALPLVPFLAKPAPAPVRAAAKVAAVPNLKSLKREGAARRPGRREALNAKNFSMDDLVSQYEDREPQTLEPLPKENTKPTPARVAGDTDAGNRRYTRYGVNIPVKVVNNTQEFLTLTRDISEGGVRLADSLPDAFAGYCQVVLTPADRSPLHLLCSLVEDQEDGKYHLEFVDSEGQADFIAWLRRQKWAAA